jgi:hypothetical protein
VFCICNNNTIVETRVQFATISAYIFARPFANYFVPNINCSYGNLNKNHKRFMYDREYLTTWHFIRDFTRGNFINGNAHNTL